MVVTPEVTPVRTEVTGEVCLIVLFSVRMSSTRMVETMVVVMGFSVGRERCQWDAGGMKDGKGDDLLPTVVTRVVTSSEVL